MDDSPLVYSTEPGRVTEQQSRSKKKRAIKKSKTPDGDSQVNHGKVRIRREVKGRKGKQVTAIYGLNTSGEVLKQTAVRLKRVCGTGGSVKDGCIIIQGDHRKTVLAELVKLGYQAHIAGG